MASKKGIAITVIILAAITSASFLLWIIPQENDTTFIVTDYQGYLDGAENIHEVLQESIDMNTKIFVMEKFHQRITLQSLK